MISGAPITPQNSLGAAQNDPASTGSGSWLGRAIKVLKAVTCFVSGVAAVAALSTGFYVVAAVCGAIFAVSGLSLLFGNSHNKVDPSGASLQSLSDDPDDTGAVELCSTDQSEPVSQLATHKTHSPADYTTSSVYRGAPTPVRPGLDDLETCKLELHRGQGEVGTVLNHIFIHCLTNAPDLFNPRKQLDILINKEPFDDKLFLELAQLLRVDQLIINGHQRIDKSEKIALLEREYQQLKEVPKVQQDHTLKLMADLDNIKQNLKSFVLPDRSIRVPDPVSDIERAIMKEHLDAFDSLLSRINQSIIAELIRADEELQRSMSKAAKAVQKCRNIFAQTTP
ncbi:hypothetical protein [Endozoicomonas sp. GU-1]|uniref:hypothetical protein n=1 Tax=Endozoicomonas sp. GU-1 TaxID=3009078 RepID=UPI0022B54A8F|nr:hypothetical protein [Endozoicomonas sp. GU-1]WBA81216.1 hypothetical protein O2T12_23465 [Endozoicomonas sp. GU-1]